MDITVSFTGPTSVIEEIEHYEYFKKLCKQGSVIVVPVERNDYAKITGQVVRKDKDWQDLIGLYDTRGRWEFEGGDATALFQ